ncbi:MAG: peroxiredoxin [Candidatus Methanoplasma sp.]|jgi:peroxiredoxin Q/BCP|nr:peroxiredoxin [Candidatus Methanoplasma sp.]
MEVGDKFPEFDLCDENGESFDSGSLGGLRYVIYFYSKDGTPGCTKEASEFSALFPKFMLRNMPVIGVSRDSEKAHAKFRADNALRIKLLSDPSHELTEKAGAWGKKVLYGKETEGTVRSTFIVGRDGTVEAAWKSVKVAGHAEKVLEKAIALFRA